MTRKEALTSPVLGTVNLSNSPKQKFVGVGGIWVLPCPSVFSTSVYKCLILKFEAAHAKFGC